MQREALVRIAKKMLDDADSREDAEAGYVVGNTVVGSILSLIYKVPRQESERAVCEALRELNEEEVDAK